MPPRLANTESCRYPAEIVVVGLFRLHPRLLWLSAGLALVLLPAPEARAHDIPPDVTVQAFIKPEGDRLRVVVRAPLVAMRDLDWPLHGSEQLDLERAGRSLRDAATLWIADDIAVFEGGTKLSYPTVSGVRASPASDRSFDTLEQALAHINKPSPAADTYVSIREGFLDALLEYPIQSEQSRFSVDPRFGRLGIRTRTVIRFVMPDGDVRAFEVQGNPGLVRLDPRWDQAALRFVRSGFEIVLGGTDYLLFLLCLVVPFRSLRELAVVIAAFAAAHSLTLVASAYVMAVSLVYLAVENIVGLNVARRWRLAFGFGLAYGFAFSCALRPLLQFSGSHFLTSLLAFNVGLVAGQLVVLAFVVPALQVVSRRVTADRLATIIVSAIVAHTGWHWMTTRADQLSRYRFSLPELTPALLANVLSWLMVAVALVGVFWLAGLVRRRTPRARITSPAPNKLPLGG